MPVMASRPRVLCVDDEPLVLAGLEGVLRRRFEVVTATSGEAALRLCAAGPPFDVIVSDFQMPVMDGAEFLFRARACAGHAVRVLLTGQASVSGAIAAVNRGGIFRFLTKPCPPEMLVRTIEEAAEEARLAGAGTAELTREISDTRRLLFHAERLATLGTLVSAVSHELNNMVNSFQGTMTFVHESRAEGRPSEPGDLEVLDSIGSQLQEHARQLLRLSKPAAPEGGVSAFADLRQVVADAITMLRAAGALRLVLLDVELPEGPLLVALDRMRAEQILVNLIKNAADACAEAQGRVRRVRVCITAGAASERVTCVIEDNGVGIPTDALDAIFEPYFTTKPSDKGTGLGLFVVRRILADSGGSIVVESRFGEGSRFVVSLPRAGAHG